MLKAYIKNWNPSNAKIVILLSVETVFWKAMSILYIWIWTITSVKYVKKPFLESIPWIDTWKQYTSEKWDKNFSQLFYCWRLIHLKMEQNSRLAKNFVLQTKFMKEILSSSNNQYCEIYRWAKVYMYTLITFSWKVSYSKGKGAMHIYHFPHWMSIFGNLINEF